MKNFYFIILLVVCSCSQKKNNQVLLESDFCSSIHRNDSVSLSAELKNVSEIMTTKTGVYVLEDGAGSMVARAWLSEYSEKTIDIQYFIFSIDNIGTNCLRLFGKSSRPRCES
ncbi:hypothetical protein [Thalassobellus suaedae]|uniref:Uncharacterized protein n=1 Tax=Thalassobellus suaedae TaxID=3074124 RepID=A0ABY9XWM2_9FLAO|nr:hypothetical protein RHP51_06760 [Flavobacteriaceae bacterium HL-DH14]